MQNGGHLGTSCFLLSHRLFQFLQFSIGRNLFQLELLPRLFFLFKSANISGGYFWVWVREDWEFYCRPQPHRIQSEWMLSQNIVKRVCSGRIVWLLFWTVNPEVPGSNPSRCLFSMRLNWLHRTPQSLHHFEVVHWVPVMLGIKTATIQLQLWIVFAGAVVEN